MSTPAPTDNVATSPAVVKPEWAVRIQYQDDGKFGQDVRISDAIDAATAAEAVLADFRARRPEASIRSVESFHPAQQQPRKGLFG